MLSMHQIFQLDGRNLVSALFVEENRNLRDLDRRLRINGNICLMKRQTAHKHIASGYDPAGRRETGSRNRDIVIPETIQHGVRLASQVPP